MEAKRTAQSGNGQLVGVRLQPPDLVALDAWRLERDDSPSRLEAVRLSPEPLWRPPLGNTDELFKLIETRAARVAELPEREREAALATIRGQHEQSGLEAGMTRTAALEMADYLDVWIRQVLRLRPGAGEDTLH